MEHAGKVISGQVGDLLVYFRRKVPDFSIFWEKFPKFVRVWTINAPKIKISKIGDFTSEIHQKFSNLLQLGQKSPLQHVPLALNIDFRDFEISAFEVQISHRNPYIFEISV